MADNESREPFNPNLHLMQIKGRNSSTDYLPVQWRLVWFRTLCPDGTIETEIIHLDLERETEEEAYVWNNETRRSEKTIKRAPGIAVFRATVKDGKGGMATGTKSEKAASFPDFIEKAETGSIGRALAALGYGTQFTGGEFDEQHRIVDAPVEREPAAATATSEKGAAKAEKSTQEGQSPAITNMTRKAYERAKGGGITTKEAWDKLVADALGKAKPMGQWTLQDVAKINGELTRREKQAQPEGATA